MQVLAFTAPGDPVAWGRPRFKRIGSRLIGFVDKKTRKYKERIMDSASEAIRVSGHAAIFPIDGPVMVEMVAVFRRPKSRPKSALMDRKPDGENILKGVLDAMEKCGCYVNDSRVVKGIYSKEYGDLPETRVKLFTMNVQVRAF